MLPPPPSGRRCRPDWSLDGHVMIGDSRDASLSVEQLLATMERLGIDRALVSPAGAASCRCATARGTSSTAEAAALAPRAGCSPTPSRRRGSATEALEELRSAREAGARRAQARPGAAGLRPPRRPGRAARRLRDRVRLAGLRPHRHAAARAAAAGRLARRALPRGRASCSARAARRTSRTTARRRSRPRRTSTPTASTSSGRPRSPQPTRRDCGGRVVLLHGRAVRRPARSSSPASPRRPYGRRDVRDAILGERRSRACSACDRPPPAATASSSTRRCAPSGLDADELIDGLLAAVGPQGLVVMPTFTYDNETFAPRHSGSHGRARRGLPPPAGRGALGAPDLLRRRDRAGRRRAARRPRARRRDRRRQPARPARGRGGLVLLLGVGHTSNTTVHVGEFHADASRISTSRSTRPGRLPRSHDRFPGCSRAFGVLERPSARARARSATAASARARPARARQRRDRGDGRAPRAAIRRRSSAPTPAATAARARAARLS